MKVFVLSFIFNETLDKVVLIQREQEPYDGLLNGIGGKVQESETIEAAMEREWKEEVQQTTSPTFSYLTTQLLPQQVVLHTFYGIVQEDTLSLPIEMKEGKVNWHTIKKDFLLNPFHGELAENVPLFLNKSLKGLKDREVPTHT